MKNKRSEHGEQAAFWDWVRNNERRWPELKLMHAIPNGAAVARVKREDGSWSSGAKQAGKLKAEGLRPGMPDMHLPVKGRDGAKDRGRIGLWLEFKVGSNKPDDEQERIIGELRKAGHRVEVVYSCNAAIRVTEHYISVPPHERTVLYDEE